MTRKSPEITPEIFRRVLGQLAGGVTVVTSIDGRGEPCGFTATSVTAVSLNPPLVLVCAETGANTPQAIRTSGVYAINMLSGDGAGLAERFASADADKFSDLDFETAVTGAPLLEAALAYCDCAVTDSLEAGDHTIFVGRVEAAAIAASQASSACSQVGPLIHHAGRYTQVSGSTLDGS